MAMTETEARVLLDLAYTEIGRLEAEVARLKQDNIKLEGMLGECQANKTEREIALTKAQDRIKFLEDGVSLSIATIRELEGEDEGFGTFILKRSFGE